MQVNKVNQQVAFQSKFMPNVILEQTFDRAARENDRFFLKAVNVILNDGKNDVLQLNKRAPKYVNLYVNNEMVEEENTYLNYYNHTCAELIKHHAEKISNEKMTGEKYQNLSQQEKNLILENVDLIKMFSETFDNSNNYIENVQKTLGNIKQQLDTNVKQEIQKLKSMIFGK